MQLRLAYVLLAEKKAEAAEGMFQKLYAEGQGDLRPVVGLTQALVLGKKQGKALALLGKDIEVRKDKAALMALRGEVALGAGMKDLAWEIGQERLRLEPKSPAVRSFLGDVLISRGDQEGAVREMTMATELAPKDAFLWKKLAFLQQMKKNWSEAERCYRKSLELDGKQADAKNNLANLLVDQGKNLEEAERLIRGALAEAQESVEYQDTLGWVLLKRGKKEEALRVLADLAMKRPEDGAIRYHYGAALAADGQKERARREFNEAVKKNIDPAFRQEVQQALENTR